MKYWIFDGSDVVGPFTPQELAARPGFASTSLICPENFSDDEDSWKPASKFPEFQFDALDGSAEVLFQETEDENFEKEMDTLLQEQNPLDGPDTSALEGPSLEIPKKPSKPGPIEEYFNTINGEDLGDILGIPDPNESSDMNLARALESQFDKTNPPTDKEITPIEDDPFDEFSQEEEKTKTLPPAQESSVQAVPSAAKDEAEPEPVTDKKTEPEENETEPVVLTQTTPRETGPLSVPISKADESEEFLSLGTPSSQEQEKQETKEPAEEKPSVPVYEPTEEAEPVQPCELPTLVEQENPLLQPQPQEETTQAEEPIAQPSSAEETKPSADEKSVPEKEENLPDQTAWFPFPTNEEEEEETEEIVAEKQPKEQTPVVQESEPTLATEKETPEKQNADETAEEPAEEKKLYPEINKIRSQLKNTPEIENFLNTQRIKTKPSNKKMKTVFMLLLALLAVGVALYINTLFPGTTASAKNEKTIQAEIVSPVPAVQQPVRPVPPPAPLSAEDKVLAAVQNYQLPGGKGTIASYFDRIYKDKLDKGYMASWSAEPLHRSTYIVKYRLTKTRMEPIVYVFQADATRGRLTGALNNIALDLVGKI